MPTPAAVTVACLTGATWTARGGAGDLSLSVAATMETVSKLQPSGSDGGGGDSSSSSIGGGSARDGWEATPAVRLFGTLRFLLEDFQAASAARPPPLAIRDDTSPATGGTGICSADTARVADPSATSYPAATAVLSRGSFSRSSAAAPALLPKRPETVACSVDAAAYVRAAAAVGVRAPGPRFAVELLKLRDKKKLFEDATGIRRRPVEAAAVATAALAGAPFVVAFRLDGSGSPFAASRPTARGSRAITKYTAGGRQGRLAGGGFGSLTASHRWPDDDEAQPKQVVPFVGVIVPSHTDCECPHCQLYAEERSIAASPSPPQHAPSAPPAIARHLCGDADGGGSEVGSHVRSGVVPRSSVESRDAQASRTVAAGAGLVDDRRHRRSRRSEGVQRRATDRTTVAAAAAPGRPRPITVPELGGTSRREVPAPGSHGGAAAAAQILIDGSGGGAADETQRSCSFEDAVGSRSEGFYRLSPPAPTRDFDKAWKTPIQPPPESQPVEGCGLASAGEDARLPPVSSAVASGKSAPEKRRLLAGDGCSSGSGGGCHDASRYDPLRLPAMSGCRSEAIAFAATTDAATGARASFSKRSGCGGGSGLRGITTAGHEPAGEGSDVVPSARPVYKLRYSKGGLLTSPLYGSLSLT